MRKYLVFLLMFSFFFSIISRYFQVWTQNARHFSRPFLSIKIERSSFLAGTTGSINMFLLYLITGISVVMASQDFIFLSVFTRSWTPLTCSDQSANLDQKIVCRKKLDYGSWCTDFVEHMQTICRETTGIFSACVDKKKKQKKTYLLGMHR